MPGIFGLDSEVAQSFAWLRELGGGGGRMGEGGGRCSATELISGTNYSPE